MLVNPPSPDGGIWIRSQHRVGRRSRENMIWPQVSLAQIAAILEPDYTVEVVDCIATRMTWPEFEKLLEEKRPRYYLTQVTAPTLRNDMHGVFLAKALGARTMAFGTHVTPLTLETLRPFPALDFVLRGEPEMTLRELLDTLEGEAPSNPAVAKMVSETKLTNIPFAEKPGAAPYASIAGLAWRDGSEIVINPDRPFIANLDDLPIPMHELLPLERQRMPMIKGPFTFIVTSRGCTAGCKFCIKHVSYQNSIRLRSPEKIVEELQRLSELGIHNIHMYADLFTVNRDQVLGICDGILSSGLKVKWTCNSRVDYVDEEMLRMMGRAGNWLISWGIESANEQILKRTRKGYKKEQAFKALQWALRRHQELGLLHHRPARRDRRVHPGDHRVLERAAARHRPLPHRSALPRHPLLLRGGREQLVPTGHELGRSRHGCIYRAGLSGLAGRTARVLAEARHQGVVAAAWANDLHQGLNTWDGFKSGVSVPGRPWASSVNLGITALDQPSSSRVASLAPGRGC
jgi:hypothetical protein